MNFFGRKSVSSILEVSLTVAWYLCIVLMAGILWSSVMLLNNQHKLLEAMSQRPNFTFILKSDLVWLKLPAQTLKSSHFLVGFFALAFVKSGFALAVIYQMKRIFRTLRIGQIFKDKNARRVRAIGLLTLGGSIANTLFSYFIGSLIAGDFNIAGVTIGPSFHLNSEGLFTGLVLIVLAEIFRHGTALQAEQDLTV